MGSVLIYSALSFPRAFAFFFRLDASFIVHAFHLSMVRIKFTARPCTSAVSPKFGSMASNEALKASTEHRETSTKQLLEFQGGQQPIISTEATLE
jgi:hypothetical protein